MSRKETVYIHIVRGKMVSCINCRIIFLGDKNERSYFRRLFGKIKKNKV